MKLLVNVSILSALMLATACSSHKSMVKQRVEAKIAAQQVTEEDATKPSPIEDNIQNNKLLTPDDKQELLTVVAEVREKNRANIIERVKIRNVLVQEMAQNYNSEEVQVLKKKLLKNMQARVQNMFFILDRFEQILQGHDQKDKIMQHALHNEMQMNTSPVNTK